MSIYIYVLVLLINLNIKSNVYYNYVLMKIFFIFFFFDSLIIYNKIYLIYIDMFIYYMWKGNLRFYLVKRLRKILDCYGI